MNASHAALPSPNAQGGGTDDPRDSTDRNRLYRIFWTALALRLATAIAIHLFVADPYVFAPDQLT